MKTAIPISGRVTEFDITLVTDVDEADDALAWLDEQVTNMVGQIDHRTAAGFADKVWLSRINLALKRTRDLRHDVQRLRGRLRRAETLERQRETERVFMDAACSVLPEEPLKEVFAEMHKRLGDPA